MYHINFNAYAATSLSGLAD